MTVEDVMVAVARVLVYAAVLGAGVVVGLNWHGHTSGQTVTRYKLVPVRCSSRPPVGPLGPTGPVAPDATSGGV